MEITIKSGITEENLNDLMVAALEGGINYWAEKCEITENPKGRDYASEVVASGGVISIIEDDGTPNELTREKLLKGVKMGMEWGGYSKVDDLMEDHDAETADVIVQYALFDEIVYG